jgi:hypothetical protein
MPRLHRNNAAERVMVAVLAPVAWIVRRWRRPRRTPPAAVPKPRRPVIEGLPPRTLN